MGPGSGDGEGNRCAPCSATAHASKERGRGRGVAANTRGRAPMQTHAHRGSSRAHTHRSWGVARPSMETRPRPRTPHKHASRQQKQPPQRTHDGCRVVLLGGHEVHTGHDALEAVLLALRDDRTRLARRGVVVVPNGAGVARRACIHKHISTHAMGGREGVQKSGVGVTRRGRGVSKRACTHRPSRMCSVGSAMDTVRSTIS